MGHRGPAKGVLTFRETYKTMWLIEKHGLHQSGSVRQNQLQPVAKAT